MIAIEGRKVLRQAGLVLWALVTLLLLFCVSIMGYELARQGHDPWSLVTSPRTLVTPVAPASDSATSPEAVRDVVLLFAGVDGRLLVPETQRVALGRYTAENCRRVLEALIQGPRGVLTPILPSSARIHGVYFVGGGELVVDFSRELLTDLPRSASAEGLMVYGIVNSLTQDSVKGEKQEAVRSVRFLIEGSPPQEASPEHPDLLAPKHLDLSMPVTPNPRWVVTPTDGQRDHA